MLNHILPADVENKCDARLKCDDVSEVLLGAYAKICARRFTVSFQLGERVLKQAFVRHEVVRKKITTLLGKVGNQFPEFLVGDADW